MARLPVLGVEDNIRRACDRCSMNSECQEWSGMIPGPTDAKGSNDGQVYYLKVCVAIETIVDTREEGSHDKNCLRGFRTQGRKNMKPET